MFENKFNESQALGLKWDVDTIAFLWNAIPIFFMSLLITFWLYGKAKLGLAVVITAPILLLFKDKSALIMSIGLGWAFLKMQDIPPSTTKAYIGTLSISIIVFFVILSFFLLVYNFIFVIMVSLYVHLRHFNDASLRSPHNKHANKMGEEGQNKILAETYWLSETGIRHNKTCAFYRECKGKECKKSDGIPCSFCGG